MVRFKFIVSGGDAVGILRLYFFNYDTRHNDYYNIRYSNHHTRPCMIKLTVTEGNTVKTYSMAALQALPSVSGNGGYMGKGGSITGPFPYQGVALSTLLNAVGGIAAGQTVTLTSSDNYSQQLTYDQIANGTLNYYDTTGNPVTPSPKPTLTIVYSQNGAALDSSHGPTEVLRRPGALIP